MFLPVSSYSRLPSCSSAIEKLSVTVSASMSQHKQASVGSVLGVVTGGTATSTSLLEER